MNTDKRRLKGTARRAASTVPFVVLSEPKLTNAEKLKSEHAWRTEIRRRRADFKAGKVREVPAEEVVRNACRALDRMTNKRIRGVRRAPLTTANY